MLVSLLFYFQKSRNPICVLGKLVWCQREIILPWLVILFVKKLSFTVCCGYTKDMVMRKPWFENGAYVYDNCSDCHNELFITQYSPIRFKISISGETTFTVNSLVLNDKLNMLHANYYIIINTYSFCCKIHPIVDSN